ncbi:hypothetical protein J5893_03595 [bacterium]|nr:hypothetical protein [bacterium]
MPNEDEGDVEAREALAEEYYQDIQGNPNKMAELTEGKTSENVFYHKYDEVSLAQLPTFYQKQSQLLTSLSATTGKFSAITEGVYGDSVSYDQEGNPMVLPVEGFTFFRVLDSKTQERTAVTYQDVIEVLAQMGVSYSTDLNLQNSDRGVASGDYQFIDGTLRFNNGEFYSGQEVLNTRILALTQESTLGKTLEETLAANEAFAEKVTEIKDELAKDLTQDIPDTSEAFDGWIALSELQQAIPSFDAAATDVIQSYEGDNGVTYILIINDKKLATEHKYSFLQVD